MKKYLCIGGEIISKNDGQKHYVTAKQVASLYGVDFKECVFMDERDTLMRARRFGENSMLILRPREDGDYKLGVDCPRCKLPLVNSPSENCWYCFNTQCELYSKQL